MKLTWDETLKVPPNTQFVHGDPNFYSLLRDEANFQTNEIYEEAPLNSLLSFVDFNSREDF